MLQTPDKGRKESTWYMSKDMLKDVRAVIFDLDGTLIDSMWMWKKIDVEYLGQYGLTVPEDLQEAIEGFSFSETARYFKERFQLPDEVEQIKETWNKMAWEKYTREVPLKEGAAEFLYWCLEQGIRLGIATSNSRELVSAVADAHGLNDFFSCILTGCDIGKSKPEPDIYLEVAKRLGVEPTHCLLLDGILPGIQAGKSAGMKVCAVEDDYSMDIVEEKKKLADYYIKDYRQVWDL